MNSQQLWQFDCTWEGSLAVQKGPLEQGRSRKWTGRSHGRLEGITGSERKQSRMTNYGRKMKTVIVTLTLCAFALPALAGCTSQQFGPIVQYHCDNGLSGTAQQLRIGRIGAGNGRKWTQCTTQIARYTRRCSMVYPRVQYRP